MTDKNRIQRENAVAEALLGPGKTARNLMRVLMSAYESGYRLEVFVHDDLRTPGYFVAQKPVPPQPADAQADDGLLSQVDRMVLRDMKIMDGGE